MQTEVMTAKQMRRWIKENKKRQKLAKKHHKANEIADPQTIREIVDRLKNPTLLGNTHWMLFFGEDDSALIKEVFNNFNAYKREFRKLGYKLCYQSDCSGSGFSVSF